MTRPDAAGAGLLAPASAADTEAGLTRGLGLFDAAMIVVGSMIGSGVFLVTAEMSRQLGSVGWLLVSWGVSAALTVVATLSYGELAAMMPRAGGQYVYLREAFSPLVGFVFGWTSVMVIQTGTIAAVSVGFARHLGALVPGLSDDRYLVPPIHVSTGYAFSLSAVQLVAILLITLLTWVNVKGLNYGRLVQNGFTTAKTAALLALIVAGLAVGWNREAVAANFQAPWQPRGAGEIAPGLDPTTAFGLFVALCVAQVGSLFACDAWNNVTFTAGEVRDARRSVPRALALGAGSVVVLYFLANVAYVVTLPLAAIQQAPGDRVAATTMEAVFPGRGSSLLAVAIMVSTFGCCNGLVLSGARTFFAMARDGLFLPVAGRLNRARVPGWALALQGAWAAALVLPRTYDPATGHYGNVYSNLLEYIVSAALLFYALTIAGLFRLRATRPHADRPYRAPGYPLVPMLYVAAALVILAVLCVYRPATTWPGLLVAVLGVPAYAAFRLALARRPGA